MAVAAVRRQAAKAAEAGGCGEGGRRGSQWVTDAMRAMTMSQRKRLREKTETEPGQPVQLGYP